MTTQPAVRPFRIDYPDEALADLNERLRRTRFPSEVEGSGWAYGTNLDYMRELVAYWLDRYDWRSHEAAINAVPAFMATVDGFDIHFQHVRGKGPNPLPLLVSHGWPGSFYEMHRIVGPLSDPAAYGGDPADAFDVVVPSLPGFGFSPDPRRPGVNTQVMADLFTRLMRDVLGYQRFGTQGGDFGSIITQQMAFRHPESVAGVHLNFVLARPPSSAQLSEEEQAIMAEASRWQSEEGGYQAIQGTKPQTLAYGLTDSPVGVAAWLVEKLRSWSDCGGDIESVYSKDTVLTAAMVFWISGCIGSSTRLYYESRHTPAQPITRIDVPVGYAKFPGEVGLAGARRAWAERTLNIQRWTEMPRGGHFAALEQPELLVEDVRAFFRALRR